MTASTTHARARARVAELRAVAERGISQPWSYRAWSDYGEPGRMVVAGGADCYIVADHMDHGNGPLITTAVNALPGFLTLAEDVLDRHESIDCGNDDCGRCPICPACGDRWPCSDARSVLTALNIEEEK